MDRTTVIIGIYWVDGTAENALKQIEDRKYYSRYIADDCDKTVHLLGLSFSLNESEIAGYKEKILN